MPCSKSLVRNPFLFGAQTLQWILSYNPRALEFSYTLVFIPIWQKETQKVFTDRAKLAQYRDVSQVSLKC